MHSHSRYNEVPALADLDDSDCRYELGGVAPVPFGGLVSGSGVPAALEGSAGMPSNDNRGYLREAEPSFTRGISSMVGFDSWSPVDQASAYSSLAAYNVLGGAAYVDVPGRDPNVLKGALYTASAHDAQLAANVLNADYFIDALTPVGLPAGVDPADAATLGGIASLYIGAEIGSRMPIEDAMSASTRNVLGLGAAEPIFEALTEDDPEAMGDALVGLGRAAADQLGEDASREAVRMLGLAASARSGLTTAELEESDAIVAALDKTAETMRRATLAEAEAGKHAGAYLEGVLRSDIVTSALKSLGDGIDASNEQAGVDPPLREAARRDFDESIAQAIDTVITGANAQYTGEQITVHGL